MNAHKQGMNRQLTDAAKFIESQSPVRPKIAIVLGSGLGKFAEGIRNSVTIPFENIPYFLPTNVEGHEGHMILGTITNKAGKTAPVAVLKGRLHYYEGHSMDEVVFPLRTLCLLGIETVFLTNSAGAVNPSFREADLMMITDHLNLMGDNPLRGANLKELGPRFPDLSEAYNLECQNIIRAQARILDIELREGVYAALSGPTYETPAEVRMLRTLGADAIGMSTVPEVIAANHFGIRVCAVSCITNFAAGLTSQKLSHTEVITNAGKAVHKLLGLLNETIPELPFKAGQ